MLSAKLQLQLEQLLSQFAWVNKGIHYPAVLAGMHCGQVMGLDGVNVIQGLPVYAAE